MSLSAGDLDCMRSTLATTLPGTAIISRTTQSSDGMGGITDAWGNAGTVAARVSPSGAGVEAIAGGEVVAASGWVVTVPVGTDVTERDRIVYDGQTYEVTRTSTPRSYATCIRLECKKVD